MKRDLMNRITQQLQVAEDSPNFEIQVQNSDQINTMLKIMVNEAPAYEVPGGEIQWLAEKNEFYVYVSTSSDGYFYEALTRTDSVWFNRSDCQLIPSYPYTFNGMENPNDLNVISIEVSGSRDSAAVTSTIVLENEDGSKTPFGRKLAADLVIEPPYQVVARESYAQYKAYYKTNEGVLDVTTLCDWNHHSAIPSQMIDGLVTDTEVEGSSQITAIYKGVLADATLLSVNKQICLEQGSVRLYFSSASALNTIFVSHNAIILKKDWEILPKELQIGTNTYQYVDIDLVPGFNEIRFTDYKGFIGLFNDDGSACVDTLKGVSLQSVTTDLYVVPNGGYQVWSVVYNGTQISSDVKKIEISPRVLAIKQWIGVDMNTPDIIAKFKAIYKEGIESSDITTQATWLSNTHHSAYQGEIANINELGTFTVTASYNNVSDRATVVVANEIFDSIQNAIKIKLVDNNPISQDILSLVFNNHTIAVSSKLSVNPANPGYDEKVYRLDLQEGANVLRVKYASGTKNLSCKMDITNLSGDSISGPLQLQNAVEFIYVIKHRKLDTIVNTNTPDIENQTAHFKELFLPENKITVKLGYGDLVEHIMVGAIDSLDVNSKEGKLTLTCRDNMRYLIDQTIDANRYGEVLHFPLIDNYVQVVDDSNAIFNKRVRIKINNSNIRSGPGNDSKYRVVAKATKDNEYMYLGTFKGWYAILYKNATCYVQAKNAKVVPIGKQLSMGINLVCNAITEIRENPSDSGKIKGRTIKGQKYIFRGDVNTTWCKLIYKNSICYAKTTFFKKVPFEVLWNQINANTNVDNMVTPAHDIVQHLTVMALEINPGEDLNRLNRTIANFSCADVNDYGLNGKELDYTIKNADFETSKSYYDASMEIVNNMGSMDFRCSRYGNVMLFPTPVPTNLDEPHWIITDYETLMDSSLKCDVTNIRSRLIIEGKSSTEMYEHVGITYNILKGVHRTTRIQAKWVENKYEMRQVARDFFRQVLSNYKQLQISIPGNPLIDIGHICRIKDKVTGDMDNYCVREWKHFLNESGFTTSLTLDYIPDVEENSIKFLTNDFPSMIKKFHYNLKFNKGAKTTINIVTGIDISKAKIDVYDESSGILLTELMITEKPEKGIVTEIVKKATPPVSKKYVVITKNRVNIRSTPSSASNNTIVSTVNSGTKFEYLGLNNKWYKMKDLKTGATVYVYSQYAKVQTIKVPTITNSNNTGVSDAQELINLITPMAGHAGYLWGSEGQKLDSQEYKMALRSYGASKVSVSKKWLGMRVFDCSGLICWALGEMGIFEPGSHVSAETLYTQYCYPVSKENLKPGDLCFTKSHKSGKITHVTCYIGNGKIIGAQNPHIGVIERDIYSSLNLFGRLRCLNVHDVTTAQSEIRNVNLNRVSKEYQVDITKNFSDPTIDIIDKVKTLGGKVLCYKDNSVLYSVGITSYEAGLNNFNNMIELKWLPTITTQFNNNLYIEIFVY